MEENRENKTLNVKDWIILSTTMIAAVLTILALVWQVRPSSGIVSATFLLMLSFIFFFEIRYQLTQKHTMKQEQGKCPKNKLIGL